MKDFDKIHFKNRIDFRYWLENNHRKSQGIWMIYYKKHTKRENITYDESVEEAICFGWIDSIIKKVDEDQYVRKFTPRTNIKNWSDANKRRAAKLIKIGKMNEAGLNKIDINIKREINDLAGNITKEKNTKELEIPDFIVEEFAKNEPALINFKNLATSYKRHYILWITNAKRKETINNRLKESIELLKENKKLGLR